jgi:ABC-2 type transport system permease protein
MRKILIIIAREYLTRVRKRSFIIMSVIGPLLFAALMVIPAWLSQVEETDVKKIAVIDSSHLFMNVIPETEYLKFDYLSNVSMANLKENFSSLGYFGILYKPPSYPMIRIPSFFILKNNRTLPQNYTSVSTLKNILGTRN